MMKRSHLAQAWDKCNFSIRWHFASGGIPMQCLHTVQCTGRICLRIKLKKKDFLKIQRCWLFILRQCLASLVFSDLATRWVVYWIRSAGEPGEKIAELGQIFTNQLYLFRYFFIAFVSFFQVILVIYVYWIISAGTPGEV